MTAATTSSTDVVVVVVVVAVEAVTTSATEGADVVAAEAEISAPDTLDGAPRPIEGTMGGKESNIMAPPLDMGF